MSTPSPTPDLPLGFWRSEDISGLLWRMSLKHRSSEETASAAWLPLTSLSSFIKVAANAVQCRNASYWNLRENTDIYSTFPFKKERLGLIPSASPHQCGSFVKHQIHWTYTSCVCLCFNCPRGSGLEGTSVPTLILVFMGNMKFRDWKGCVQSTNGLWAQPSQVSKKPNSPFWSCT